MPLGGLLGGMIPLDKSARNIAHIVSSFFQSMVLLEEMCRQSRMETLDHRKDLEEEGFIAISKREYLAARVDLMLRIIVSWDMDRVVLRPSRECGQCVCRKLFVDTRIMQ